MKMHEYQNKGVTENAFRKLLILKDAILVVLDLQGRKWGPEKQKREQGPAIRMQFSTGLSVPENKEKSIGFFVFGGRCDEVEQGRGNTKVF
jgi:hypothetical protein